MEEGAMSGELVKLESLEIPEDSPDAPDRFEVRVCQVGRALATPANVELTNAALKALGQEMKRRGYTEYHDYAPCTLEYVIIFVKEAK